MDAAEREKIDPEMKDEDGFTAFDLALQEQGEDDYVIEAFLQCKMRLSDNALDMAVYGCASNEENASKVKLVLNAFKWTDFHLCRALKIGIRVGALHAVRLLLRHARIPLLHCKDEEQKMPLHWAAEAQKPSVLEYLIDEDADLNVLDGKGIPPLGYTISTASTESSKLLLNRGANVWLSEGEWQGSTILNFGVSTDYQSSRSMLRYLLSADLDEEKPRRFPMLHDKAVLDATDRGKGNTVLHRAAIIGDYEGVFSLVSAGASTQIRNNAGLEPLEAVEKKLQEVLTSSQQMTDHVSKLGKIITYLQSLRFWKSE
jgi:ankyrin repeat protein